MILAGLGRRAVVLSQRSLQVYNDQSSREAAVAPLHVTMNEGLSNTDRNYLLGAGDLESCLRRGLQEELGFTSALLEQSTHLAFYDFMLVRANFELGITAVVEFDTTWEEVRRGVARDRELESEGFTEVPLTRKSIAELVESPHGRLTDACRYSLERLAAREGIAL